MKQLAKKVKWKKVIIFVVIVTIVVVGIRIVLNRASASFTAAMLEANAPTTAKAEIRDIESVLSSSGVIEPLNTYQVTTLVEGEVISADFEEGDYVEEGQVLYQIDTDNLDNQIEKAETALARAKKNYEKAQEKLNDAMEDYNEVLGDYNEAKEDYGDANITSEETGVIRKLFVEEGDTLQIGSQIAEIYDNSSMLLKIPFNAIEADQNLVGKSAEITMTDSYETIEGTVTEVSSIDEVLSGNRLVNIVTIKVKNPGGLTAESTATASIGKLFSSGEGTFEPLTETTIIAEKAGKIANLKIKEGSKISEGDIILTLDEKSVEDYLESFKKQLENAEDIVQNAKDNLENAEDQIEDAETSLQEVIDNVADYSITAPISGQIISKDALEGDTITSKSVLCVIYDLSAAVFEMYIDELDVTSVEVGQEVKITADAFEDKLYKGVVTNVSLQSTASGGVTQYPVTVRIDEVGELLPGMNVTGEIVLDKVENVIAVPSEALMRGDVVYVADPSATEAVGEIPAGFREVKVETGLTDGDFIEIKSGLTGEEEVYVKRNSGTNGIMYMMPAGGGPGYNGEVRVERGEAAPRQGGGPNRR